MRDSGSRRSVAIPERQDYLASVSDVMSALIFIFVITLGVFALRLEETRVEKDDANRQLRSAEKTRAAILSDLEKRLAREGLEVEVDLKNGVLRLSEKAVLFDIGNDAPVADHHPHVGVLARVLAEVLPCFVAVPRSAAPGAEAIRPDWCAPQAAPPTDLHCDEQSHPANVETLLIEGHTDSRPIRGGRFRDNLELSAARASEVLRMLTACEPDLAAFVNEAGRPVASVSGYAATRPVDLANPFSDRNRRIDLRFIMELPREVRERGAEREPIPEAAREVRDQYDQ